MATDEIHSCCERPGAPPAISIRLDPSLALAAMIAFIAALPGLGNRAYAQARATESSARPLRFMPEAGPIEGGRWIFIDVAEPGAAGGSAAIACRFGAHTASPGQYDATSARYLCRTPAHPRPESVPLTITVNGSEFRMPVGYDYTTHGKSDAPVTAVDVPRLQQQVQRVRERIPPGVKLCAVLKNGEPVGWLGEAMARATTVDYFCVPNVQDGIALREVGVTAPIMVLYLTEAAYAPLLLHYDLEPAAYSLAWVAEVDRLLQGAPGQLKVHLWIDTGLSREGVMPDEALALARGVSQSPQLHLQGIATHFCCVRKTDRAAIEHGDLRNRTALQKHRFDQAVAAIRAAGIGRDAIVHAGASDVLRFGVTPTYYDMLRVGTLLFENPVPEHRNYTWQTHILQIKTLPKGWCLDYDCKTRFKAATRVGLVAHVPNDAVGYLLRGRKVKKLLDHEYVIVLDLSPFPDAREGEALSIVLPEPHSPLESSGATPVTLRDDGAAPEKAR